MRVNKTEAKSKFFNPNLFVNIFFRFFSTVFTFFCKFEMVTQIVNDQHLKTTTIIALILLETFINSLLLFFRLFLKLNPF